MNMLGLLPLPEALRGVVTVGLVAPGIGGRVNCAVNSNASAMPGLNQMMVAIASASSPHA
jgi:hypothetical protein